MCELLRKLVTCRFLDIALPLWVRADLAKRLASTVLSTLQIYRHQSSVLIAQDVPRLCIPMKHVKLLHGFEYAGNDIDDGYLVGNSCTQTKAGQPS